MKFALMALLFFGMSFGATGCSMLGIEAREGTTPEQRSAIIKATARTATFLALTEAADNDAELIEKVAEFKAPLEADVLPLLLDGSVTFDEVTIRLIQDKIDPRYRVYLNQAITLLNIYYTVPEVGEIMPPEDVALWLALFQGMVEGADDALLTVE